MLLPRCPRCGLRHINVPCYIAKNEQRRQDRIQGRVARDAAKAAKAADDTRCQMMVSAGVNFGQRRCERRSTWTLTRPNGTIMALCAWHIGRFKKMPDHLTEPRDTLSPTGDPDHDTTQASSA